MSQDLGQNQNIDDIIKRLKSSLEDREDARSAVKPPKKADREMSTEDLQSKLKDQYMGESSSDTDSELSEADTYKLDDDFLAEAAIEDDDNDESAEAIVEDAIVEEEPVTEEDGETVVEIVVEEENTVEEAIVEESEETVAEEESEELSVTDDDDLPWFEDGEASDGDDMFDELFEEDEEIYAEDEELYVEEDSEEDIEDRIDDLLDSLQQEDSSDSVEESEALPIPMAEEAYDDGDEDEIKIGIEDEDNDEDRIVEDSEEQEEEREIQEEDPESEEEDGEFFEAEADGESVAEEIRALDRDTYEYYENIADNDIGLIIETSSTGEFDIWEDGEADKIIPAASQDGEDLAADAPDSEEKETYISALKKNNLSAKTDTAVALEEEETEAELKELDEFDEAVEEDSLTESDTEAAEEENADVSRGKEDYLEDDVDENDDMLGSYFESLSPSAKQEVPHESEDDEWVEASGGEEPEVNDSAAELLSQFGYQNTETLGEDSKAFDSERVDNIRKNYKRKKLNLVLSFVGTALIALALLVYDILPLLGVELGGVINYRYYPASYTLMGLQLLVFCIIISWKKLWDGVRTIFSFSPDHNAVVAAAMMFTVVYDIIIAIAYSLTKTNDAPPMFNFMAAFTLTLSLGADLLMHIREMRVFDVYFSETKKYTSVSDSRKNSVAEKMYRGGLASDQNVYVPADFTASASYFRALDDRGERHKVMYRISLPCVAVAFFVWIFGVILDRALGESVAAAMTVMFSVLPISVLFADVAPLVISGKRLYKRDIAVAGVRSIRKFSDCNVMVFRDIHFFEKCTPQNTGMVFYDEKEAHTVFKCLHAVYSELGGPMSDVFSRIAKSGEAPLPVRFIRIASNGTEAVVDGNRSLLVGTFEFMKRYGLEFPVSDGDRSALTVCVALNGKPTAKISVKYRSAGIFEMLAERLAAEGVFCAIETYDPLINSALITKERAFGTAPISVVHLNLSDLAREKYDEMTEGRSLLGKEPIGVVVGSSRLKLAEVLIWCKRLVKIRKRASAAAFAGSILGAVLSGAVFFLNWSSYVNQFVILIYQLILCLVAYFITTLTLPQKNYFDIDAFYQEMNGEEEAASEKDKSDGAEDEASKEEEEK